MQEAVVAGAGAPARRGAGNTFLADAPLGPPRRRRGEPMARNRAELTKELAELRKGWPKDSKELEQRTKRLHDLEKEIGEAAGKPVPPFKPMSQHNAGCFAILAAMAAGGVISGFVPEARFLARLLSALPYWVGLGFALIGLPGASWLKAIAEWMCSPVVGSIITALICGGCVVGVLEGVTKLALKNRLANLAALLEENAGEQGNSQHLEEGEDNA
jgi:hypothetical protein